MPSTANAAQLATVSFLGGLNPDGTVAAQSYADWTYGSVPATYDATADVVRKWFNNASGTPLAATSRAGTPGGTVTYAFDAAVSAPQQAAFVAALTLWSDLANIAFAPAASTATADVRLSVNSGAGTETVLASAYSATVGGTAIPSDLPGYGQASIGFDTGGGFGTLGSFSAQGGYGVSAPVHEVGHLIGLGHAGPYDDGAGSALATQRGIYDSRQWSVMSYISPDDPAAAYYGGYTVAGTNWRTASTATTTSGGVATRVTTSYEVAPETPMPLDILAAQQLYGAPTRTTFSGGQVFGFNTNITDAARPVYDFTQNTTPVVTIWDAGGGNTLDLSGFAGASLVNLNPGSFSSAGGLTNNIGIAFGTAVDTAIGGPGDDSFIVNDDADTIDGGGGTNTVVLPGTSAQYTVTGTSRGSVVVNTATGVRDTLANIQRLAFSDGTVQLASAAAATAGSADPLFDAAFYLARNPDVAAAGVDPYAHYLAMGWKEGRDPSALFSGRYYLNQNPDVAAAGLNPLLHLESSGWREGRDPSVLFSTSGYLAHNADVVHAGMDPLLHYVASGRAEGRGIYAATPHATGPRDPLVNAALVYAERPDVAAAGLDATAWFHAFGWHEGTKPDALFDVAWYLARNPDVAAAHVDPLVHFATSGWREGRSPSAAFSTTAYLQHNPDVAVAGMDPLVHYLGFGQSEGRAIYPA